MLGFAVQFMGRGRSQFLISVNRDLTLIVLSIISV